MSEKHKCGYCGAEIIFEADETTKKCRYCHRIAARITVSDDVRQRLTRADQLRLQGRYKEAEWQYNDVLAYFPDAYQALWGVVLCRYEIEYVRDPRTDEQLPICHSAQQKPMRLDKDFQRACELAPEEVRTQWEADGKYIDNAHTRIRELQREGKKYDVFLCYKETDPETGERTWDSQEANTLYTILHTAGYEVFYAPKSLQNRVGEDYEAVIFYAIETCKIMVVMGSKPDYFTAPWVKSEWSRFLDRMDNNKEKRFLFPLYRDMKPEELPREFRYRNLQGMAIQSGYLSDLKRAVEKSIGPGMPPPPPSGEKKPSIPSKETGKPSPLPKAAEKFSVPAEENGNASASAVLSAKTGVPSPASAAWPLMMADSYPFMANPRVLGGPFRRQQISAIYFKNTLAGAPAEAWDASQKKDRSVLAWVVQQPGEMLELYIAGEGGVRLPENCSNLFRNYKNLRQIDFGGCVDTTGVSDMKWMFENCGQLEQLDLTCFDTGKAKDVNYMFDSCTRLKEILVSQKFVLHIKQKKLLEDCPAQQLTYIDAGNAPKATVQETPKPPEKAPEPPVPVKIPAQPAMLRPWPRMKADNCSVLGNPRVLESTFRRQQISAIYFKNTLADAPIGAWDVSENADRSVLAWTMPEPDQLMGLYIAGEGGVRLPPVCSCLFRNYRNVRKIDFGSCVDTTDVLFMIKMFRNCFKLESLDLSLFDTRNVTNMEGMFAGCSALQALDLAHFDHFDTSHVTCMQNLFRDCARLQGLDLAYLDTSSAENMSGMFQGCSGLESLDLTRLDTHNAIDISAMFAGCSSLTTLNVSCLDTSKATYMNALFQNCRRLKTLDLAGLNTSQVSNMSAMFQNCLNLTVLDLSNFQTGNVTDMQKMFYGCSALSDLNVTHFDTSSVVDMSFMFNDCSSLTTLNLSDFNTNRVGDMSGMFMDCRKLTSIQASPQFIIPQGMLRRTNMFNHCPAGKVTI